MRIGIDLGGTKIEGIVLDTNGDIIARRREPTPHECYADIVARIRDIVAALESVAGQSCTVGVGMPGILSPHSGRVKNSNTRVLNGKALDTDLGAVLERSVRFENDANCFALSEAVDGAARGEFSVFGVIIGTGTGGGLIIGGRVIAGRNAIAGEWGHNPLPWSRGSETPGRRCYCGRRGCLETYLSGAGLAFAYREAGGWQVSAAAIALRAQAGEPRALRALEVYADRLARGLASVINVVDPDVVVLGGGLSNISGLVELTQARVPEYVFSDAVETRILRARHGDSSGVRGAAWLWPESGRPEMPE